MFVKNNKNPRILSKVSFEQSKLIDIIKEEDFDIISGKIIPFVNVYYVYRFKFSADLKKALKTSNIKVRLTLRESEKKRKFSMFDDLGRNTSLAVTAAVLRKGRDNKSRMIRADRNGIIHREFIDLREYLDSFKIKSFEKIPDREMFGTQKKTVLVKAGQLKGKGANATVQQREIQIESNDINPHGFKENYIESLRSGIDPSSFFFSTQDETPIDAVGTFVTPDISKKSKHENNIMMSMRDSVTQNLDRPPKNSVSQFGSSELIAFSVDEVATVREISVTCKLPKNKISSSFVASLDIIGQRGIIVQTIRFSVDHKTLLSDFLSPDKFPTIAASMGDRPTNSVVFKVGENNNDPRFLKYEIYCRTITETTPLADSKFVKMIDIMGVPATINQGISPGGLQSPGITISPPPPRNTVDDWKLSLTKPNPDSGSIYIFRVVGFGGNGACYGNFDSYTLSSGNHMPYNAIVSATSVKTGIQIVIRDVPGSFSGAYIMRRDLTCHQKKYEPLISTIARDDNEGGDIPASMLAQGELIKNYTFIDKNVIEGSVYEYAAGLVTVNGIHKVSCVSRIHKFIKPIGIVEILVSNIAVSSQSGSGSTSRGSSTVVSFDVAGNMMETDSDILVSLLDAAGLTGYYSEELESLTTEFHALISYVVYREDLISGDLEYLGVFSAGTVSDDGINISSPKPGRKYSYRVMASLVSPQDVINELTYGSAENTVITSTATLRNPQSIASVKSSVALNQDIEQGGDQAATALAISALDKSYSTVALSTGTLSTGLSLSENWRSSVLGVNLTGDFVDFKVDTLASTIEISPIGISRTGSGSNLIKWNVKKTDLSQEGLIDYFIIKARKGGRVYCTGTSFGEALHGGYKFVDTSNKKFIGKIEYLIQPVFYTGDIGRESKLGTIIQEKQASSLGYRR